MLNPGWILPVSHFRYDGWSILVAGHHYSNQYYSAPFVKERPRSHDSCGVGHGCGRGLP